MTLDDHHTDKEANNEHLTADWPPVCRPVLPCRGGGRLSPSSWPAPAWRRPWPGRRRPPCPPRRRAAASPRRRPAARRTPGSQTARTGRGCPAAATTAGAPRTGQHGPAGPAAVTGRGAGSHREAADGQTEGKTALSLSLSLSLSLYHRTLQRSKQA